MPRVRSTISLLGALLLGAACTAAPPGAPRTEHPVTPGPPPGAPAGPVRLALPPSALTEDQRIVHAVNRLAYGPRPGDVEQVRRLGLRRWIEQQLSPESVPDDALEARLRDLLTLPMTTPELLRQYPPPETARREVKPGERPALGEVMRPAETDRPRPAGRGADHIVAELKAAKMVRAVWSERQLQEVMVDFWFNHFNVFARKGAVRWMITAYERDAIRPHALGRFRDLLLATARHPAMLFYLDNWLSVRPDLHSRRPGGGARPTGLNENYARELLELHTLGVDGGYSQQDVVEVARCFTGWSVDRPRQDGQFVFRALAHDDGDKRVLGQAIPAGGGESDGIRVIGILSRHPATARFIADKLARRFVSDEPPPGVVARAAETFRRTDGDIRQVLAAIVGSPEFWSAEAYRAKIKKPVELVASAARAVGARPAGGSTTAVAGMALARAAGALGEAPYEAPPPTGYGDTAAVWVSAGALLARMNFALDLTQNRVRGVSAPVESLLAGIDRRRSEQVLDRLLAGLLSNQATAATREVLARHLADPEIARATSDDREAAHPARTDVEKVAALVLGSPEFQRR